VDLQASREGILFHGPRHYASIKYPFEGISEENTSTINPWLSQRDADAAESRNNESRASREDADKFTGPLITFPPRPPYAYVNATIEGTEDVPSPVSHSAAVPASIADQTRRF